jgi:hypothetical protein
MNYKTTLIIALLLCGNMAMAELPEGYWTAEQTQPILDATLKVTLDSNLAHLTLAETQALEELLAAGRIMHELYEEQLHPEAHSAKQALDALRFTAGENHATSNLVDLYYLSKGPIVTTLDNERLPFLPVAAAAPGKNVYPVDLTREEFDAYVEAHSGQAASLLAERAVVRRATAENIAADLATLEEYPAVDALHGGLRTSLEALVANDSGLYAVPYALAYAPRLDAAKKHLDAAATILEFDAPDFAAYLQNRGRDLLSGDYESGDASWVSAEFRNLNLQFGSYETYNDSLLGVKAFYSASLLARDEEKSRALAAAMTELQSIENSLPYEHQKRVRSQVPVGVYNVVADFGQARGANTATILPNDADHARKYGRIVLIRNNILTNPEIFENRKLRYAAVLDPGYHEHITSASA